MCAAVIESLLVAILVFGATVVPGWPHDTRSPSFAYTRSSGCMDLLVLAYNEDATEVLAVQVPVNPNHLPTPAAPLKLDLAKPRKGVRVWIDVYAKRQQHNWPCGDVIIEDGEVPTTWLAARGVVIVSAADRRGLTGEYAVDVVLQNVLFRTSSGARVSSRTPIRFVANAGAGVGG